MKLIHLFLVALLLAPLPALATPLTTQPNAVGMIVSPCNSGAPLVGGGAGLPIACGTAGTGVASLGNAAADTTMTYAGTGSGPYTGTVTGKINLSNANIWAGAQTFANGDLLLKGSSSGAGTLEAPAAASTYVWTLPALTDTLAGAASTTTFTNKTLDTAGTGNVFKINGTQITAISGNSATAATSTGSLTNGHCVSIDASGNFVDAGGACTTGGGGGTVTSATAGQITWYAASGTTVVGNANATISNGALVLGQAGSVVGSVGLNNVTSGTITLASVSGALGTVTASFPANSGIVAELNLAETWTAAQTFTNGDLLLKGSSSGAMTLEAPAVASSYVQTFQAATDTVADLGTNQTFSGTDNFTGPFEIGGHAMTFPGSAATLAGLGIVQSWSAAQTFPASDLLLGGSTSGAIALNAVAIAGSNVATFPANTGTVAELNLAQSWTATQTFSSAPTITTINSPSATPLNLNTGSGTSPINLQLGGTTLVQMGSSAFYPYTNNGMILGIGGHLWNGIYATLPSIGTTGGVVCYTSSNGEISYNTSSCLTSSLRYKHDIEPLTDSLAVVDAVDPISFLYNDQSMIKGRQDGVSAESLAAADPLLVEYDDKGRPDRPRPLSMIARLFGAVQELHRELESLKQGTAR